MPRQGLGSIRCVFPSGWVEGGWLISGRKIWTTNAPIADYCVLFAVTDKELAQQSKGGISAFMVPTATELHAALLMGLNVATLLDQGHAAIKELSMTQAYSVQVGYKAVDRAMQTHGTMGFTNELGLTDAWHALRVVNVADGTNEILNRTIIQRLLKGDVEL